MRVLLLGSTGNLGSRLIPALLAHHHIVIAYVRSQSKLQSLLPTGLIKRITVYEGEGTDSEEILRALREFKCDAIINTAGVVDRKEKKASHGLIAAAVLKAAAKIKKESGGKTLRVWLIGGLGSMEYPGTGGWKLQDYMPFSLTFHHRETAEAVNRTSTNDVRWSLLCVAMMKPESEKIDVLEKPYGNNLSLEKDRPPIWQDHWIRYVPFIGVYANLWLVVLGQYETKLEQVADFIAADLENAESTYIGAFVGMKQVK